MKGWQEEGERSEGARVCVCAGEGFGGRLSDEASIRTDQLFPFISAHAPPSLPQSLLPPFSPPTCPLRIVPIWPPVFPPSVPPFLFLLHLSLSSCQQQPVEGGGCVPSKKPFLDAPSIRVRAPPPAPPRRWFIPVLSSGLEFCRQPECDDAILQGEWQKLGTESQGGWQSRSAETGG